MWASYVSAQSHSWPVAIVVAPEYVKGEATWMSPGSFMFPHPPPSPPSSPAVATCLRLLWAWVTLQMMAATKFFAAHAGWDQRKVSRFLLSCRWAVTRQIYGGPYAPKSTAPVRSCSKAMLSLSFKYAGSPTCPWRHLSTRTVQSTVTAPCATAGTYQREVRAVLARNIILVVLVAAPLLLLGWKPPSLTRDVAVLVLSTSESLSRRWTQVRASPNQTLAPTYEASSFELTS